jgi:hypothetical protein
MRDVAGSYHETERRWQAGSPSVRATLQLNNDGTMTMNNVPDSADGQTICLLTGSGRWSISGDDDAGIDLFLEKYDSSATCKIGALPYGIGGVLSVAGHAKPYSLYWILGDPDSGEGLWLRRN